MPPHDLCRSRWVVDKTGTMGLAYCLMGYPYACWQARLAALARGNADAIP